jgi:hypothetical protein
MGDVILVHYLQIHLFTEYVSYEGMGFWQAVHLIYCYLWVDLGSSRYSFTHSLAYAIFQNSLRCTNQHHTSHKNTMCSLFCSSLHTHGNDVAFPLRANAGNVSLPGDLFGIQMDSVSLEIRHLQSHFFMGFCNQITNKNLPEPLVCHFTATCFMDQEGTEDGHIC